MTSAKLDEPWSRYDADFPNDDRYLAIPMHNALELRGKAYLLLLAMAGWSRLNKTDGAIPNSIVVDLCQRLWPSTPTGQILNALLDRKVRLVRRTNRGLELTKQRKWQITSELTETLSEAGRRGASKRWGRDGVGQMGSMAQAMENKKEKENKNQEETESLSTQVDQVREVFEAWKVSTGHNGRTVLDDKRRRVIKRALEQYPLDDVLDAVEGWREFPHNRGENDRHRPFNDLELLLRNAANIERFRDARRGAGITAGRAHPLDTYAHNLLRGEAEA